MSIENSMNENNEEYLDNTEGDSSRSYNLLKKDYEMCRQENHDSKRRLELNKAMLRTVQETNELLEHSIQRLTKEKQKEISVLEEKHRRNVQEYENMILNLEAQLAERKQEFTKLQQQAEAQCTASKCTPVADESVTLGLEVENVALKTRVEDFESVIKNMKKESERAEETIECLKNRCEELESYCQNMKERLEEKDQLLEETRAELALRRAEAAALENAPASASSKGNSLFAEVEDRRQSTLDKMKKLREQYVIMKRMCKSQIAEIKKLSKERIAMFRELETINSVENDELIKKYKDRIFDLERKLKAEINKKSESKLPESADACIKYFQSSLNAKKEEINELRIKIEDFSTKLLIQEEVRRNIVKELLYWKCKAPTLEEALLYAEEIEQKFNLVNDADDDVLKEFDDSKDTRSQNSGRDKN